MSERLFDLQAMLLEIQEDEASDSEKVTRLSQNQIQELMVRRKTQDPKQDSTPTDVQGSPCLQPVLP